MYYTLWIGDKSTLIVYDLSVEKEKVNSINIKEKVIDAFAKLKNTRDLLIFLLFFKMYNVIIVFLIYVITVHDL